MGANTIEEINAKAIREVCEELAREYGSNARIIQVMLERASELSMMGEKKKSYFIERVAANYSLIAKKRFQA